jgi:hypothetical protein
MHINRERLNFVAFPDTRFTGFEEVRGSWFVRGPFSVTDLESNYVAGKRDRIQPIELRYEILRTGYKRRKLQIASCIPRIRADSLGLYEVAADESSTDGNSRSAINDIASEH